MLADVARHHEEAMVRYRNVQADLERLQATYPFNPVLVGDEAKSGVEVKAIID